MTIFQRNVEQVEARIASQIVGVNVKCSVRRKRLPSQQCCDKNGSVLKMTNFSRSLKDKGNFLDTLCCDILGWETVTLKTKTSITGFSIYIGCFSIECCKAKTGVNR